jgi:hypothetical protein
MCLDLLTNATVVNDAIRFVSRKSKGNKKLKTSSSYEDDTEESKEPDYSEYKQTEEGDLTEKKTMSTINKIF